MKHKCISSKMKKGKPLLNDPFLSAYVPKTEWFNGATLQKMMSLFPIIYIKPDKGSAGLGIIRVKRRDDSESLLSFRGKTLRTSNDKLLAVIKRRLRRNQKYIIQQGIELATYRRRPFDLRVVLLRPFDRWQLTWMSAKVAPKATSIVTNVARGAVDARMMPTLRGADQFLNVGQVLDELKMISHQIAVKLGSRFPFRILGLDMAIDTKGKVWFIEANTSPSFHGLKRFDPVQYERYRTAKRLIDAHRY